MPVNNFPKEARVRKRSEYLKFFHQSDVKRLESCIVFRIPNEKGCARVGITVKARVNSVLRNAIKRQIRECFRLSRQHLNAYDYNVVVPSQIRADYLTATKVRKSLETIWYPESVV